MERLAHARHLAVWEIVDARLELSVLWAVGDASGPCASEVKIGVSTRKAYADEIKKMGNYRSAEVVTRYETIISGRGRAELLKTALLATLEDRGLTFRSWRRANVGELSDIVAKLATTYRVRLMTHDEAVALEHEVFDKVAAEHCGGV